MSFENRKYLQRKVMIYFGVSFIITLSISIIFYLFTAVNSIVSLMAYNVIDVIIGSATALIPILKVATEMKEKVK